MTGDEEVALVALARRLCVEHLPPEVTPEIRWGRATRAMGTARVGKLLWRRPVLTFSRVLFAATSHEERVETVHHEVAHVVAFVRCGHRPEGGAHGPAWRAVMAGFGYASPSVKHSVVVARAPRRDDVILRCGCREHRMTIAKIGRRGYMCRACGELVLSSDPAVALAIALLRLGRDPRGFPELPRVVHAHAQTVIGWPGASVLRLARELLPTLPATLTT